MPLPQTRLLLLQVRLAPVAPIAAPAINPPSTPVTPSPATVHGFQMSPLEELAMLGAQEDVIIKEDDSDDFDDESETHIRVSCLAELARYKKSRNLSPFQMGPDGKTIMHKRTPSGMVEEK